MKAAKMANQALHSQTNPATFPSMLAYALEGTGMLVRMGNFLFAFLPPSSRISRVHYHCRSRERQTKRVVRHDFDLNAQSISEVRSLGIVANRLVRRLTCLVNGYASGRPSNLSARNEPVTEFWCLCHRPHASTVSPRNRL